MRKVIKKIVLCLCVILCMSCLWACGTKSDAEKLKNIMGSHEFGETVVQLKGRGKEVNVYGINMLIDRYYTGEDYNINIIVLQKKYSNESELEADLKLIVSKLEADFGISEKSNYYKYEKYVDNAKVHIEVRGYGSNIEIKLSV